MSPDSATDTHIVLRYSPPGALSRDEIRDNLLGYMNEPGATPAAKLTAMFTQSRPPEGAISWAEADLDGDGTNEFIVALPVVDPEDRDNRIVHGAALFVIYQKDGRYAVDRTARMAPQLEVNMMAPLLHGVADLAGMGRPQIVWSRPGFIASGPQPFAVFVTAWEPGSFTDLPGHMVVTRSYKGDLKVALDGNTLLLSGGSRMAMFSRPRTDLYRFLKGAFHLVDRRFLESSTLGHDHFWDGLVAEGGGRTTDAERSYTVALDGKTKAHSGEVLQYHAAPKQLTTAELDAYAAALHSFARFRLGALLIGSNRKAEVLPLVAQDSGPFKGLTDGLRHAESRADACQAGVAWAEAHPDFLAALNRGEPSLDWTPGLLCTYPSLNDASYFGW